MTPAQQRLTAEGIFAYALGEEVRIGATDLVFRVAWRRFHEGPLSCHVLYGLCREGYNKVWQAYEPDLEPVYTVRRK